MSLELSGDQSAARQESSIWSSISAWVSERKEQPKRIEHDAQAIVAAEKRVRDTAQDPLRNIAAFDELSKVLGGSVLNKDAPYVMQRVRELNKAQGTDWLVQEYPNTRDNTVSIYFDYRAKQQLNRARADAVGQAEKAVAQAKDPTSGLEAIAKLRLTLQEVSTYGVDDATAVKQHLQRFEQAAGFKSFVSFYEENYSGHFSIGEELLKLEDQYELLSDFPDAEAHARKIAESLSSKESIKESQTSALISEGFTKAGSISSALFGAMINSHLKDARIEVEQRYGESKPIIEYKCFNNPEQWIDGERCRNVGVGYSEVILGFDVSYHKGKSPKAPNYYDLVAKRTDPESHREGFPYTRTGSPEDRAREYSRNNFIVSRDELKPMPAPPITPYVFVPIPRGK